MSHSDVLVVFPFECLLLEGKEHGPTPLPQLSLAADLKGKGWGRHTEKNEFILSKLRSRIPACHSRAVLSLSCICNNKVLKKMIIKKKRDY